MSYLIVGKVLEGEQRSVFASNLQGEVIESLPHLVHHSPDGFCWGYYSSGPAELALSILEYVIQHDEGEFTFSHEPTIRLWKAKCTPAAWYLHQEFKSDVLSKIRMDDDFVLTGESVMEWIEKNIQRVPAGVEI